MNLIKDLIRKIGPQAWHYLKLSMLVGLLLFAVESSFVFVFQGFLSALGLLDKSIKLPDFLPANSLAISIVSLVLFGLFRAYVYGMRSHLANMTQHSFMHFHRSQLLRIALENTSKVSTKEVISLFSDTVTSSGVLVNYLAIVVTGIVCGILYFSFAMYLAPVETILGVLGVGILLLPMRKVNRKVGVIGEALVPEWQNVNDSLLLGIRNNFFLKIYSLIDSEVLRGQKSLDIYKEHVRKFSMISSLVAGFPSFIGLAVLCSLSYLSVTHLQTSPVRLVAFFYIFIKLVQSLGELSQTITNCRLNWPGFLYLTNWEDQISANKQEAPSLASYKNKSISQIDVQIDEFSYGTVPVLQNIHFQLSKGESLVIKGPSGAGKSTLLSLLLGVNKATKGDVKISGVSASMILGANPEKLAYVGPEPYLIKGSIRENLLYGSHLNSTTEDMYKALGKVGLREFVESLPYKLDQALMEVAELSTGQKQRLSLARALLRNYEMLILDEATSNLDQETERKIIEILKTEAQNKIVVVVTHRHSFDQMATRMLHVGPE